MRNIIIIECWSTGLNFIEDIVNRGYKPVVLEVNYGDSETGRAYKEGIQKEYEALKHPFDIIYEKDTYEETLEEVRKWDPLLILPGNEGGVILASKLSHDLNLKCNPIENLDAMTLKNEMQNRIAEHGLRSIKGKVVNSTQEAIEFYDSENLKEIVAKPIYSAGSVGVKICLNKEEMINYTEEIFSDNNVYGEEIKDIVIQERINGEEYIVNTVSCEGIHRVTTIWKYRKTKTPHGDLIYDTCETVDDLNIGEAKMIEYAYDVADALGIKYGPVHGEYMIDENGPVLIEVNCRPCGGHMSAQYLNRISGQHETDSILDSYLNPERFNEQRKKPYTIYEHGAFKFYQIPREITATAIPIKNINVRLESFVSNSINDISPEEKRTYFKTEDVATSLGITYLCHKDKSQLQKDLEFLRSIEKHAYQLILTEEKENNEGYELTDIESIIDTADKYGTTLLITDQFIENTKFTQTSPNNLNNVGDGFDFILYNLNKSLNENNPKTLVQILLDSFTKVKTGGIIYIPQSTYDTLQSGREGMEALLKVLDFKIEVPPHGVKNSIVASKR